MHYFVGEMENKIEHDKNVFSWRSDKYNMYV
jgi:hypothetical protein